jgi:hypothetical protein
LTYRNEYLPKLILTIWLLSAVMVLLTASTPLEFVPLPLGNLPRWGFWLLVFPVARWLTARAGRLAKVWRLLPWLLWTPLILLQLFTVGFWFSHPQNREYAAADRTPWTKVVKQVLSPLELVFAQNESWSTGSVEYRRGNNLAVRQLLRSNWGAQPRRIILTPVLPGLQWCVPISEDSVLKAPWQVVDTVTIPGPK